jgi:hypothetical protein
MRWDQPRYCVLYLVLSQCLLSYPQSRDQWARDVQLLSGEKTYLTAQLNFALEKLRQYSANCELLQNDNNALTTKLTKALRDYVSTRGHPILLALDLPAHNAQIDVLLT